MTVNLDSEPCVRRIVLAALDVGLDQLGSDQLHRMPE